MPKNGITETTECTEAPNKKSFREIRVFRGSRNLINRSSTYKTQ